MRREKVLDSLSPRFTHANFKTNHMLRGSDSIVVTMTSKVRVSKPCKPPKLGVVRRFQTKRKKNRILNIFETKSDQYEI